VLRWSSAVSCRLTFFPDRHTARHKEKDDEAGGEGLGILATRKRLWRDEDGNILNSRRPTIIQEGAKRRQMSRPRRKSSIRSNEDEKKKMAYGHMVIAALRTPILPTTRAGSPESSTIVVDTGASRNIDGEPRKLDELRRDSWLELSALPSPPVSEQSINSAEGSLSAKLSDLDALYDDSWPAMHNGLPLVEDGGPVIGARSQYPASPSWGPQPFQTFMGAMAELPYDNILNLQTGLYDWQAWDSQVLMSRCRDEKNDPFEEAKREWRSSYPGQEGSFVRRWYGPGTC